MSYYNTIRATQKSGRAANREAGKPAADKRAANPAGKRRDKATPYAWWVSPRTGWKYVLLKSYQGDNSKEYARWFMWVEGIYSEYGDEYCSAVRGAHLRDALSIAPFGDDDNTNGWVWFDATVWNTVGEFAAWAWGER